MTDGDARDAIAAARALADAAARRHGLEPDGGEPAFDASDGRLTMTTTETSRGTRGEPVERTRRWRLGPIGAGGRLDDATIRDVEGAATRQARRRARRAAIEAAGGDDAEPAWAHTMHALALAMLREARTDPAVVTAKAADGRELLRMLCERAGLDLWGVETVDGRIDAQRLESKDGGLAFLGSARPTALVRATTPATAAAALVGMRLDQAVGHPAVRRAGRLRILAATHVDEGLALVIEDRQAFVRRPPKGADRRWARIPFHPTGG